MLRHMNEPMGHDNGHEHGQPVQHPHHH
jgi:hypothetical protein